MINEGSASDLEEDMNVKNFRTVIHSSFFLNITDDVMLKHIKGARNGTVAAGMRELKKSKFQGMRYNSQ